MAHLEGAFKPSPSAAWGDKGILGSLVAAHPELHQCAPLTAWLSRASCIARRLPATVAIRQHVAVNVLAGITFGLIFVALSLRL
ncbi:MAG: hypothetical protein WBJ68_01025 [Candidatus Dechloromonas phosphoritropha]|jgi:hypothetical protein